ncbi:DEAD/DEAH box helicase family protein [Anaerobiospirillum sp. NML120448]|uniref:type ISP restriction/modification enzyme n=1 Tax=Anaerobiospirillum sp. NML120448 TaxID=2932816 RepID=UPI001FF18D4C|nr:type ISP restriction/modification enzyme [Anaerobiospirillum sp. NML120448]MCK0513739.1 DEAD/DEAH box helicase family protein [Anaerobiospirillum sp. NML120448]
MSEIANSEIDAQEIVEVEKDNMQSFYELLSSIEQSSSDERDKGTRFENLVLDFLQNDPTYNNDFTKIQTYADWAQDHKDLVPNKKDIGIDLVATNLCLDNEPQTYTAIQCKFYAKDAKVPKKEIDSFIAASDKEFFTGRMMVATNSNWSDNAWATLAGNKCKPYLLDREKLAQSSIDWSQYLKTGQVNVTKRSLRSYQQTALQNVISGFKTHDRGKLIMACGTGKTYTSLKIAEAQTNNNGFVLFLVPSLALLSQTLSDWKQQSEFPIRAFAVCSDTTVGKKTKSGSIDELLTPNELNYPATTNEQDLAKHVQNAFKYKEQNQEQGMVVIFSTYQSIEVIALAQNNLGMRPFDLVICDEAHRTAGGYLINPELTKKEILAQSGILKDADLSALNAVQTQATTEAEQEPKAKTKSRKSKLDFIDEEEAVFTRVHNDQYIHAKKRLYMTATPKIYGDAAQEQKDKNEVVLYSMDDTDVFGPVFHSLNFDEAVQLGCLVDYKVIILASDSRFVRDDSTLIEKINEDHAARIIGSWKALNKYGTSEDLLDDAKPMKRAVGFAQVINRDAKNIKLASKLFTQEFDNVINVYRSKVLELGNKERDAFEEQEYEYVANHQLTCDCKHIDGSMNANEKGALLQWLREEPEQDHCKVLFNVRCLSEGVDVPALDAVIFLSPRKSQVEVVQTVGRVMRRAPGKKRGYVILPLVVDNLSDIDNALSRSDKFACIWQVLKALKAINPNDVIVDGALEKLSSRIEVVCVNKNTIDRKTKSNTPRKPVIVDGGGEISIDPTGPTQGTLIGDDFEFKVESTIKSAIIKKLGNRREWEEWAEDVAEICKNQVAFIKDKLNNTENKELRYAFNDFKDQLSCSINGHKSNQDASQNANEALFGGNSLSDDEVIEMLSQHIVIKPVLDALFKGYAFTENNPIARALTDMLEKFDNNGLHKANKELEYFYRSVGIRMQNVKTIAERQSVIVDLFDRFFKVAFPKQQEKLGIVYTPLEVVDFINHSVNDILKQEFGQTFADAGVHVLDPFTGTGTFITRLMQSEDLIPRDALPYKYFNELHAFELMPLAYYVASINMEAVYQEFFPNTPYAPNNITVLTDTFALHDEEVAPIFKDSIGKNTSRRKQVDSLDLRVIIGNPPYSVGQDSQNDDNKNDRYLGENAVDTRIKETYVEEAGKVANKNSIYDSYIKAFRWASDKLGDQGVIAFVTNAGWLDSAAANGMRKCLSEEFNSIYIYHLKGNQRTSGEESRRQGGKVFGAGSRAPIAITILVKNPSAAEKGKIFFGCVDDYMSREEKLGQLAQLGTIKNAQLSEIVPDEHNDWLNQRRTDFAKFITIDGKKTDGLALFKTYSMGISTNRDVWSYNSSSKVIANNFNSCISFYNAQLQSFKELGDKFEKDTNVAKIKWSSSLDSKFDRKISSPEFNSNLVKTSLYRPFFKQKLYNDPFWVHRVSLMPQIFPYSGAENLIIGIVSVGAKDINCLISDSIMDLHVLDSGAQCLPRYVYTEAPKGGLIGEFKSVKPDEHGYVRSDGINEEAVQHFKDAYPEHADKVDVDAIFYYIYGVLHSPEYRSTYANNLQKELARIPRVATYEEFAAFEKAGRALAQLHVNYEAVKPYEGCTIEMADSPSYRVEKLAYGKIAGQKGDAAKDRSTIIYNSSITIRNIPLEAQEYVVNKKSALDWIVERCCVSTDKDSGIVNDFNDYAKEMGDEKYIFNLILRVITVSLETMKIVKALPKLNIHPLDK